MRINGGRIIQTGTQHVCTPPRGRRKRKKYGLGRGGVWECDCGKRYVLNRSTYSGDWSWTLIASPPSPNPPDQGYGSDEAYTP